MGKLSYFTEVKRPNLGQLYCQQGIKLWEFLQILKKLAQSQKLGIKSKKEKFDQQYKIYRDRTLASEHLKKQQLLDKKLTTKN